ncbi:Hpt domain-containing protein [Massilia sp. YIM B02443]|uniref:Hpt domain-containing protein n=1 Tax=Massilia sp. YIM B02443 TaxID=3050127 RepID=UPI0025B66DED|nr:Hpt domain-containing protein [Massilia sp. YIM B02443]MDN4038643.1 Hpt domain-containing protein [Massilia sp. YIM B02443]
MPQLADQQFFDRLAELNEKFAGRLPATLERLAALSRQIDRAADEGTGAGTGTAAAAAELGAMLHTLAGSAATFGFRELGHHARLLEQRLRVLTTFDRVAAADWLIWRGELDEYIAAAQRDPKSLR